MRKLILVLLPAILMAGMAELKSLTISSSSNYVEITLKFSGTLSNVHDFVLKKPARIVIDAEDAKYVLGSNIFPVNQGDILRVRGSQFKTEPQVSRVVVDLRKMVKYDVVKGEKTVSIKVYTTPASVGMKKTVKAKSKVASDLKNKKKVKSLSVKAQKTNSSISVGASFFYNSRGRRDPFRPITQTSLKQDTLLDIAKAKLIGVIQDSTGYVALIEDKNGSGFILKRGDRIKRGRVVRVGKDMAVFAISDFGFTRTVILKLEKEEVSK